MRVEYPRSIKFFEMEIGYNFQSRHFQRYLMRLTREFFLGCHLIHQFVIQSGVYYLVQHFPVQLSMAVFKLKLKDIFV